MTLASIRTRLMLLAVVSIVTTLAAVGVILVLIFEAHLLRRVERELETKWSELAAAFTLDAQGRPSLTRDLSDPRYEKPYSGAYWQIAADEGVVARSRSLWDEELPKGPIAHPPIDTRADERIGAREAELYVIEREVKIGEGADERAFRLAVAIDHAEVAEHGAAFKLDVAMALATIAAILLLWAFAQTSFGLRPLADLRRQLSAIRDGRARRLGDDAPAEVAPVAAELNSLLDHQEAMLKSARQRAGDLAHGLKTPLSLLLAEARRLERAGDPALARRLREQAEAMRRHVERHLARARAQGAAASGRAAPARAVVGRLVEALKRMPRGAELDWRIDVAPDLMVRMDPDDFGEVMGNLLDNARRFARSRVVVTARADADGMTDIAVTDDGPGVREELRERIAERGERGDAEDEGDGLGLAIAADLLADHGATLRIEDAPGGGCRIVFRLAHAGLAASAQRAAE
ncbi:MAG: HAMP domain-containing histidine kinase [Methylobacteriaceae bacterium]|nr:HAMP domain-containing histidine kinase [Methylobacteriaceae bacterium]